MDGARESAAGVNPAGRAQPFGFVSICSAAFCLSTAATLYFCHSMSGGMEIPGGWTMSMMWMRMPGMSWFSSGAMFLLMWLTMMIAMMLPSTMPLLSRYRCSRAGASGAGRATFIVAVAYFAVWLAIGFVLYVPGVFWASATMRHAGLSRLVPSLTGAALLAAGAMQFCRWKMAALKRCRESGPCVALPNGSAGAWGHGLQQGLSCAICCSGPMLALLAVGAMNIAMMLIVAVVIGIERLAPRPEFVIRFSGATALGVGLALILRPLFGP